MRIIGRVSTAPGAVDGPLLLRALGLAARQASANTRKTYGTAYRSLCGALGAGATPVDLTAARVEAWCDGLRRGGRAPSTIAVYLSAVRALADEVGADPAIRRLRTERAAPDPPQHLMRLEVARLLARPDRATAAGTRDLAILLLCVRAGLRRAEIAGLALGAVEEHRRPADPRLRRAVPRATAFAVRVAGPRGRERLVPLAGEVLPALAAWRDARPDADTAALFVSLPAVRGREPRPLDPRDVGRIVARHAASAGLPDDLRGVHVLRHTFANGLRTNGAGLETVRDLLGHEDIRTTQVYDRAAGVALPSAEDADGEGDALARL